MGLRTVTPPPPAWGPPPPPPLACIPFLPCWPVRPGERWTPTLWTPPMTSRRPQRPHAVCGLP